MKLRSHGRYVKLGSRDDTFHSCRSSNDAKLEKRILENKEALMEQITSSLEKQVNIKLKSSFRSLRTMEEGRNKGGK